MGEIKRNLKDVEAFLHQFDETEAISPEVEPQTGANSPVHDGKPHDEEKGIASQPMYSDAMRSQIRISGYMYEVIDDCRRQLRVSSWKKITIKKTVEYLLLTGIQKKFPDIFQSIEEPIRKSIKEFKV